MIHIGLPMWALLAWSFVALPTITFLIGFFGTKLLDRKPR